MRDEIANIVYPVLSYGLELHEKLQRREGASFAVEQAKLKELLRSAYEARTWPDYGGEALAPPDPAGLPRGGAGAADVANQFLGIRYALTCWLDELFILDSSWAREWENNALEF